MRIDHIERLDDGSLGGFTADGQLVARGECALELVATQHVGEGADPVEARRFWLECRNRGRRTGRVMSERALAYTGKVAEND